MRKFQYTFIIVFLFVTGQIPTSASENVAAPSERQDIKTPEPGIKPPALEGSKATPPGREAPKQAISSGNALAAARLICIVGENVVIARQGWVNVEPGARPAYVGIQGGTAPITLLRSPTGSLLGYTGNTGNDFIHLLQGKESPTVALPPSDSKEALELPLPRAQNLAEFSASRENSLFTSGPSMEPFGLSTPEHVVIKEETKTIHPLPVQKHAKKKKGKKRPVARSITPRNYKEIFLLSKPPRK